ncbi:hypothetical protein Ancab_007388 [Ancistrocladus abbreviatus]
MKVWDEPWLLFMSLYTPKPRSNIFQPELFVQHLMTKAGIWNVEIIVDLFDEASAQAILKTPIMNNYEDRKIWIYDAKGHFLSKGLDIQETSKPVAKFDTFGAALIDCVWTQRNDNTFNGILFNFTKLYEQLERKWYEWRKAWSKEVRATREDSTRTSKLHIVTEDSIVIFFDAAVNSTSCMLTCVISNARNHFFLARVRAVESCEPCITEALACLEAIQWALWIEVEKVFSMGDCKVILDSLTPGVEPP